MSLWAVDALHLQVLPDVAFLGAVLVAVERGSAWHQALWLLEQAARCHQGKFLPAFFWLVIFFGRDMYMRVLKGEGQRCEVFLDFQFA